MTSGTGQVHGDLGRNSGARALTSSPSTWSVLGEGLSGRGDTPGWSDSLCWGGFPGRGRPPSQKSHIGSKGTLKLEGEDTEMEVEP